MASAAQYWFSNTQKKGVEGFAYLQIGQLHVT